MRSLWLLMALAACGSTTTYRPRATTEAGAEGSVTVDAGNPADHAIGSDAAAGDSDTPETGSSMEASVDAAPVDMCCSWQPPQAGCDPVVTPCGVYPYGDGDPAGSPGPTACDLSHGTCSVRNTLGTVAPCPICNPPPMGAFACIQVGGQGASGPKTAVVTTEGGCTQNFITLACVCAPGWLCGISNGNAVCY